MQRKRKYSIKKYDTSILSEKKGIFMDIPILGAFLTYFCILLAIGLIAHKKQYTSADFIMGNRSLNFWLTALSAHASDMSAWLFMAFPAAIFVGGLPQAWPAVGLFIGMLCNWQFVAKKLRTETEKYDSYTLSTYFERRFNDQSGVIRILTATMTVIFLTSYLSGGLIAMGLLFESMFGIEYHIGLSVAIFVAMSYTFSGGFITVAWTDLFQALFLLAMIILVPTVAYLHIPNGFDGIMKTAQMHNKAMAFLQDASLDTFILIVLLTFGWGLGYFGQPHIITKFMGINSASELTKSKYVGMTWQLIALLAAGAVGVVGIGFFPDDLNNSQLLFVNMVKSLFTPYFGGLILCGIIAANMSTMDSQILVCASVMSEDFYKHFLHKQASQKQLIRASRSSVVIISLVAWVLASEKNQTILEVVLYAWSGLGSAFGPLVLMSLYSKKANKYGAIAGIITGGVIAGSWHYLNGYITSYDVPSMIPGFFISLLSIIVVSRLSTKNTQEEPQYLKGKS